MAPGTTALGSKAGETVKKWLEFRASVIHDFVAEASDAVHRINKDIRFDLLHIRRELGKP